MDSLGNLYGTTYECAAGCVGTVFELTPSNGSWTENLLHSFTGSDGDLPAAGLVSDHAGNIYGTTTGGSAAGHGVVFEVTGVH